METKRIELTIASHLAVAMINADESGLIDSDIEAIDRAIDKHGPHFWVYAPDDFDNKDFTRCDICGLWADCYTCTVEVSQ